MWALLTLYQLLRMAMVEAVETRPGTNPDRASFTSAPAAARDQIITAAGICPDPQTGCRDGPVDRLGVIGRAVLATPLPARRARKVKCATSRYPHRDDGRPAASTAVTAIDIRVHTSPPDLPPRAGRASSRPRAPRPPTRRHKANALLSTEPRRACSGAELAQTPRIPAQHAHPARGVDPPRVHHPHPRRQLRARPATAAAACPVPARERSPIRVERETGHTQAPAAR